jgi:hypothetical protein
VQKLPAMFWGQSSATAGGKNIENGLRTHVGINVRHQHVLSFQMAVAYEVSAKHFEVSLHRT